MSHDRLSMDTLLIALKRKADYDLPYGTTLKKTASSMFLTHAANHPSFYDYENVMRLFIDTMHRNAMRQEESVNIQLYGRVGQLVYRIPPVIALERTRFADVIRLDLTGVASRQLETDQVLYYTFDFSYLSMFPLLEVIHISECHACLGSHLLESVPHLSSFSMVACTIFWIAPNFQRTMESGKIHLVDLVYQNQS